MSLVSGTRLGPYEILGHLGKGGMGEVYRAKHRKLGRDVAIKVLPSDLAADPDRLQRFEREARSVSALNHPNIVTIYDIAEHEGTSFIAMELVEGRTLRQLLKDGPLPVDETLDIAVQMAKGLAKAHEAGIIHRDLKPDNLMMTSEGLVKILDFGLAKVAPQEPTEDESRLTTLSKATGPGVALGTVPYMSPEQAATRPVDPRSDQFSFGIILYELLCGERPFKGESVATVLSAILRDPPTPPRSLRSDIPMDLEKVIRRCLEKEPRERYPSTQELQQELERCLEQQTTGGKPSGLVLRWRVAAAVLVLLAVAGGAATWWYLRGSGERWARDEALNEIARLTEVGNLYEAYRLARRAETYIPDDPELQKQLHRITLPTPLKTDPAGAKVYIKGYSTPEAEWELLGETPFEEIRLPYALMRWRITKEGFETFEAAPFGGGTLRAFRRGLTLDPVGSRPPGMVRVFPGVFGGIKGVRPPDELPAHPIGSFWIDRYEVTNRQFKEFVDGGGYEHREYWTETMKADRQDLSWERAMEMLRDATGRPGPAIWELGTYPEGQGEFPVGGLSWYEAAAYCASVEKSLPTLYHWLHAAAPAQFADIVRLSNFETEGPTAVGTYKGLGPYGTSDMAGNVEEWCWNETGDGEHYIMGGAWNQLPYMYNQLSWQEPLDRSPTHGFRCVRYDAAPMEVLLQPTSPVWDYGKHEPVSDEVFEAYRSIYAYDRTDLEATVDAVDDSSPYWKKETVSFEAAYGNERVPAFLFLPSNAAPPYQTVIWFPGDDVFLLRSSESLATSYIFDFLPRSGRALVYPIYKGMYERFAPFSRAPNEWRDRMVEWSKDLGRTIDYLESREDIDHEKLAYYGFSTGGVYGPIFTAIDGRFKASIIGGAGLLPLRLRPEMDAVHFAPRSRVPTLMVNGRDDFIMPVEESQRPLFELLGAPEGDKRHALLEGGHLPPDRRELIREVLDWLDRHLGPVKTSTTR